MIGRQQRSRRLGLWAAGLVLLVGLPACQAPSPQTHRDTITAYGTLVDVQLRGTDQQLRRRALSALLDDFTYTEQTWDAWRGSAVSRVNQLLATSAPFTVAPSVLPLIERAQTLSRLSQGLFNPALGEIAALYYANDHEISAGTPEAEELQRIVAARPSMEDIAIDGIFLRSNNPAVRLDFNAFAKAQALDTAIAHLRELGIADAAINMDGNGRVIGTRGDHGSDAGWVFPIHNAAGAIIGQISLRGDEAIISRNIAESALQASTHRAALIIDPRNGQLVEHTAVVTVVHQQAAVASAAATALFVRGPDAWQDTAAAMGIRQAMIVDRHGNIQMTPELAARVDFTDNQRTAIAISAPL